MRLAHYKLIKPMIVFRPISGVVRTRFGTAISSHVVPINIADDREIMASGPKNHGRNISFAHTPGIDGDIQPFSIMKLKSFLRNVNIWKDLVGNRADTARDFVCDNPSFVGNM